jgi:hypothetical protein
MKKKIKWNYAVITSIFGDLWIGKTKHPPVKDKIFKNINDAIEKAKDRFMCEHPDFDPDLFDDDENYDDNLSSQYEKMIDTDDVEEINDSVLDTFL